MNFNKSYLEKFGLDKDKLPVHVAIIMDGNGRWAKKRILNRVRGHEKGTQVVRDIVKVSREFGISYLTLFAFSTENWQRPKKEIQALMLILKKFLKSELSLMQEKNIRLYIIGQLKRLPDDVANIAEKTAEATKNNTGMQLNLALSYGAREEITTMVQTISNKVKNGEIDPDAISSDYIAEHLYTKGIPDPDLLIRTSGEMRISNFLLWQIAYSEFFITDTLWPDFGEKEYADILKNYQQRERRYGRVTD